MKRKMTSRATRTGSDSEQRGRDGVNQGQTETGSLVFVQHSSVCGTSSGFGRSAVHAASMTGVPAVRWSPAHVTVTVLITVTHLEHKTQQVTDHHQLSENSTAETS